MRHYLTQNYKIDSYIQIVLNKFNFNYNPYLIHILSTDLNFIWFWNSLKAKDHLLLLYWNQTKWCNSNGDILIQQS